MQYRNARAIAVAGVLGAAVVAIALVMPAARLLGSDGGLVAGLALFALPVFVVLGATGAPFYGAVRAGVVAGLLTLVVTVVTWVLALLAVTSALAGSGTGLVLTVAVFAVPALILVGAGLASLRLLNGATPVEDREPAPPMTPARSRLPHR
ncbi:hypothetical protein [Mycolicibacterium parafortuitum]|uniref:Uncharacterized protein n=1 Tax=Mycolicibacterium parafortuitum TaxID=39692 RepID=A0A375YCZ6_MYCPF|nr:hypothetical protein [Mycolicibacterium parafortuitum]ORB30991.1 hypothetical protein BST38_06630 [Mycolicibacterium parafortuitum]SRX78997.1 hypothetical protein MPP7335_00730 [Mycolicibacterium parafortuitum]